MPVDLSRIGLEGIETGQRTLNSIEARKASELGRQTDAFALQQAQKDQALDDLAGQMLSQGGTDGASLFRGSAADGADAPRSAVPELLSQMYFKSGATKRGLEMLESAVKIDKAEDEMKSAEFTRAKTSLENLKNTAQIMGNLFNNVEDQNSWDYVIAEIKQNPGLVSTLGEDNVAALEQMGYKEGVPEFFADRAMSVYQQATLDSTAQYRERTLENANQRLRNAERLTSLAEQRHAEVVRQNKLKGTKAKDGKSSSAPSANDVKTVTASINNLLFSDKVGGNTEERAQLKNLVSSAAPVIAARAKELVTVDKSLSWQQAVDRAVFESKANGEWAVVEDESFFGKLLGREGSPTFSQKSKEAPQPLPPDPAKYKKGQVYERADGVRARWNGELFETVE